VGKTAEACLIYMESHLKLHLSQIRELMVKTTFEIHTGSWYAKQFSFSLA